MSTRNNKIKEFKVGFNPDSYNTTLPDPHFLTSKTKRDPVGLSTHSSSRTFMTRVLKTYTKSLVVLR